jgi:hypothetical protein
MPKKLLQKQHPNQNKTRNCTLSNLPQKHTPRNHKTKKLYTYNKNKNMEITSKNYTINNKAKTHIINTIATNTSKQAQETTIKTKQKKTPIKHQMKKTYKHTHVSNKKIDNIEKDQKIHINNKPPNYNHK